MRRGNGERRRDVSGVSGRVIAVGGLAVATVLLAACTSKSGTAQSSSASGDGRIGLPTSVSTGPTDPSGVGSPPTASGSASGSTSSGNPEPAEPSIKPGDAGAYTLVTTGSYGTTAVPSVSCGQDGSLTADGIALSRGGASLTLTDVDPVGTATFTGSADLTAAGGVFRGTSGSSQIVFNWVC